jgi:hypothetical protein
LESKSQAFYYTGKDQTFNFIGGQTYTVYAWGAAGSTNGAAGGVGGYGAYVSGVFSPPTSGTATLIIGQGGPGGTSTTSVFYGGGAGGSPGSLGNGHGAAFVGGGRCSFKVNSTEIVTCGGGGAGCDLKGGDAGAVYSGGVFTGNGFAGTSSGQAGPGGGGTATSGGAAGNSYDPANIAGYKDTGGYATVNVGGGGGGYYGGGGGGNYYGGGTGGGGSSYINTAYFSCISAAQSTAVPTSSSLSGVVKDLYNAAGYNAGTPSTSNNGHGLIIIVQNSGTFNPTYLPGCVLWLDGTDVYGTGVTTISLASFVPASPTTQEVSYSVSSQYYYSLSNWTPVSCFMSGGYIGSGGQTLSANLAPSATTGIWYAYVIDGGFSKMVKLQFSITSGRIYVTALSAGFVVSSGSVITSSTTGAQNDTIYNSATAGTVATSSASPGYGVSSFSMKTSGVPSNGSTLSTWVDKSGNGNNASPSYGSSGIIPTYSNSAVFINNGGSSTYNSSTYTYLAVNSNFQTGSNSSIFAVFNFTNSSAYQAVFENFVANPSINQIKVLGTTQSFDSDINNNATVRQITGLDLGTTTSVVSFLESPSSIYLYQNGVVIGSNTTAITVGCNASASIGIGGGKNDNRWATGYFNEIICYNGLLTTAQRRQVEMYLAWKWGLSTPLSTFSPVNISGLSLWFDAADTSTISSNGSNITTWKNKGNSGVNALSNASYTTATTGVNTLNGLNVVTWPSSSQMMLSNLVLSNQAKSVFTVFRLTSGSIVMPITSTVNYGYQMYTSYYSGLWYYRISALTGLADYVRYTNSTNLSNTAVLVDGVNSTSSSSNIGLLNATSQSLDSNVGANSFLTSAQLYTLNNASYTTVYDLAELIFYDGALTTAQRQQVEGYLAWKWGLYSNLPSTHPSYYAPPAAQVSFTPAQLSGLKLWVDIADSSAITLSGSTITSIKDKSGNSSSVSVLSPSYNSSLINGLGGVNFTGSSWLRGNFSSSYTGTSLIVFAVGSLSTYPAVAQYARLVSFSIPGTFDYSSTSQVMPILLYSTNLSIEAYRAGDMTATAISTGTNYIFTSEFTGSSNNFYVNGNTPASTSSSGSFNISNWGIGYLADYGGTTDAAYWKGNFGECVVYFGTLTTAQRQQVEGYLAWKWGLQGNLPSSHAYYKASP